MDHQHFHPLGISVFHHPWHLLTYSNEVVLIVNFSNYDHSFVHKSNDAIDWYRSVVKEGLNWTVYPPSNVNLYPNMCVDSNNWNSMKSKIAKNIGEITMLWNCGIKNRMKAFHKGIYFLIHKNYWQALLCLCS